MVKAVHPSVKAAHHMLVKAAHHTLVKAAHHTLVKAVHPLVVIKNTERIVNAAGESTERTQISAHWAEAEVVGV